jgi:hypothetical protein
VLAARSAAGLVTVPSGALLAIAPPARTADAIAPATMIVILFLTLASSSGCLVSDQARGSRLKGA